ncbi:MAG: carboxymuconolactone decarboxylase family protein [Rhodospirillales bacterium]
MARLTDLRPETMSPEQRKAAEEIAAGPRGAVVGPFNALIRSPEMCARIQKVGEYLRFQSSLPARLRELTVLLVARFHSANFEWYAHAPLAEQAGVDPGIIIAIRDRRRPDFADPLDIAVYNFVRELLDKHNVSDHVYRPVLIRIGEQGVVELVALVGYYTLIAMTLNTFQIPTPDGKSPFV